MSSSRGNANRQNPKARTSGPALVAVALAAGLLGPGCDLLFNQDKTPPTCWITSPTDSSIVSGVVALQAGAADNVAVDRVEFYSDGSPAGTATAGPYSVNWNTTGLPENSWHSLYCIAYDLGGNKGYSDTVAVKLMLAGQRSVYHGEVSVTAGSYVAVEFFGAAGDTLAGDVLVLSGARLSTFAWLNGSNYALFAAGQPYQALFRQDNASELSLRQAVAASDTFHLVFANTGTGTRTCWVRFVLE
jgi:hypothetical protein